MKIVRRVIIAVVVVVVLAVIALRITGLDPKDRRPGLWLAGTVATTPVSDWSFTDKIQVIQLQTHTPYGLPHSVNIWCVTYNGQLYLHAGMPAGAPFPGNKAWAANVIHDPRVRLKIDGRLYDGVATQVTDQAEIAALNLATSKKYPPLGGTAYYFHVVPTAGGQTTT
jgi:hypothetical protein